jgi:hypothetical protein
VSPPPKDVDCDFARAAKSAWFVLKEAEALGVRLVLGLEADYPPSLPPDCRRALEDAIGRNRVLILRLLIERAGPAP